MKVLVGYGRHEVLEGDPVEGVVIAEFPTFEAAKAWYDSPAYQAIRPRRLKGAIYRADCAGCVRREQNQANRAQVALFHTVGGHLQLDEVPLPAPGKGEVRLRVKALGLNWAEELFWKG